MSTHVMPAGGQIAGRRAGLGRTTPSTRPNPFAAFGAQVWLFTRQHPLGVSLGLAIAYVASLAAVSAALVADIGATPLGILATAAYVVMLLISLGVAVFLLLPERGAA
jgi:hypothetical protein